jgi:transposase
VRGNRKNCIQGLEAALVEIERRAAAPKVVVHNAVGGAFGSFLDIESNTACFQVFLDVLARKFARQDILLVLDGAPNHRCGDLVVPDNVILLYLPPYSPELNPKENLWDEIREKIFKNYALKSMDAVRAKLRRAILYMERNPKLIRSITSFPYIVNSL